MNITNEDERNLWNAKEIEKLFGEGNKKVTPDSYDEIAGIPIQSYYFAGFDGWVKVYSDNSAILSGKNRRTEFFNSKQKAFDKAKLLNEQTIIIDKIFKRKKTRTSKPKTKIIEKCRCKK